MVYSARAYPSFYGMKQQGVSLLPLGQDASPSQGYPQAIYQASLTICQFLFILLVERGTALGHITMSQLDLEPRPLRPTL